MKITVIHSEEAHDAALRDLERLLYANPRPGSLDFERMELLALVIKDYETRRFPVHRPDPVEAIQFRLEQQALWRYDMELYLGSRARVSEILNRRRPLSLAMVRSLSQHLQIPAEVLIAPTKQSRGRQRRTRESTRSARRKRTAA